MKKLELTKNLFIYKDTIFTEKKELLSEIYLNIDINKLTKHDGSSAVGVQSNIIINGLHIDNLFNNIIYKIKNHFNIPLNNPYILDTWIYQSKKTNKDSNFHDHKYNVQKKLSIEIENEWTFVYYIQMPDNLIDTDGYLTFGLIDNNNINDKISILPKEMELYVFPAWLPHKPETNCNSEIDRIVIAGNFLSLDANIKYVKTKKSLF